MQVLRHDKTSRLIGSGPIRPPLRQSKGQSRVLQAIDDSVAGSMTAQPPGSHPSALRVAVEVGSLIGDLQSFGLVLERDFSVSHLIGCVIGDSSMFFSCSVLTVEVLSVQVSLLCLLQDLPL